MLYLVLKKINLTFKCWCNVIGYNNGPGNDTRINRGNQSGSYNGMFQSDDQQLFIGKIPPEVQESDLRVSNLLLCSLLNDKTHCHQKFGVQ